LGGDAGLQLRPWGIGAHTAEERVYLPFLRDELPRLVSAALYELARPGESPAQ
jgi:arginine utilization protein RocB